MPTVELRPFTTILRPCPTRSATRRLSPSGTSTMSYRKLILTSPRHTLTSALPFLSQDTSCTTGPPSSPLPAQQDSRCGGGSALPRSDPAVRLLLYLPVSRQWTPSNEGVDDIQNYQEGRSQGDYHHVILNDNHFMFKFLNFLQSAKLMFTVREPPSRKESTVGTRKATGGRFLYWGLVSITDHQ